MAKIMLVEDDNNLREIYEARLAAEGYDIITAPDGEAALALAIKERPDLIISDIMMPKVSGFDMLDILRSTTDTKNTKIIMMTALNQAEDKTKAEKLGADMYLVKSQVTLEDVVRSVKSLLGEQTPLSINGAPIEQPNQTDLATPSANTTSLTNDAQVAPITTPSPAPPQESIPPVDPVPNTTTITPTTLTTNAQPPIQATPPIPPQAEQNNQIIQPAPQPQPETIPMPQINSTPPINTTTINPVPNSIPVTAIQPAPQPTTIAPTNNQSVMDTPSLPKSPSDSSSPADAPVNQASTIATTLEQEEADLKAQIEQYMDSTTNPNTNGSQPAETNNNPSQINVAVNQPTLPTTPPTTNAPSSMAQLPSHMNNNNDPQTTNLNEDKPAGEQVIVKSAPRENTEPGIDASISGRKKVIQPISDILNNSSNIEALLAKESNQLPNDLPGTNSVVTPEGSTISTNTGTPTINDVIAPTTQFNTPSPNDPPPAPPVA